MGFYAWLHDFLFHILSAPKSCWPDVSKPPMAKRSRKFGGIRPSEQMATMALAGVLAHGLDALRPWQRRFLKIKDDYEAGIIGGAEMYAQLEMSCPRYSTWDRFRYLRTKEKLHRKIVILNVKIK